MIYYNITVFSHTLQFDNYSDILHPEQANPSKLAEENEKVTLFINLAIFRVISEILIEFATFLCNENTLFYQVLGEVNRKK